MSSKESGSKILIARTILDRPTSIFKGHIDAGTRIIGRLRVIKERECGCRLVILRDGSLVYTTTWLKKEDESFTLSYDFVNEGKYEIRVEQNRSELIGVKASFATGLSLPLGALIFAFLVGSAAQHLVITITLLFMFIFLVAFLAFPARPSYLEIELFREEGKMAVEAKALRRCSCCGSEVSPHDSYCWNCGVKLQ